MILLFHRPCLFACFLELNYSKFRVAGDVGSVYFGPNHPMKPHRLCMTHHLVLSYDLHKQMEVYVSNTCCLFHFYLYVWYFVAIFWLQWLITYIMLLGLFIFYIWCSAHTRLILLSLPSFIPLIMLSFCTGLRLTLSTCSQMN